MSLETMTVRSVWCPKCRGSVVGETLTDGSAVVEALRCVSCGYRALAADRKANGASDTLDPLYLGPRPEGFQKAPKHPKTCLECRGRFWPVSGRQLRCEVCRA